MPDKKEMTTNLPLTMQLRRRIMKQAAVDGRTLKPQIRVLLTEALERREIANGH